jgi:hypothetical protein
MGILVRQRGDLLLLYLIVGEVLLVLLPVLTGRRRLRRLATEPAGGMWAASGSLPSWRLRQQTLSNARLWLGASESVVRLEACSDAEAKEMGFEELWWIRSRWRTSATAVCSRW